MAPARHELVGPRTPSYVSAARSAAVFPARRGRRRAVVEFQERLAKAHTVLSRAIPVTGSPGADGSSTSRTLAFHYLDLLDEARLPRVHVVGASFGGWIRLPSSRPNGLAPPHVADADRSRRHQGRCWIYPFLSAWTSRGRRDVFHHPMAALALAPLISLPTRWRSSTGRARAGACRGGTRTSTIRCCAGGWRGVTAPTLLCWGAHDRLARRPVRQTWAKEIPGRGCACRRIRHVPHLEEPRRWPRRCSTSGRSTGDAR